jgi:hypothetical protein
MGMDLLYCWSSKWKVPSAIGFALAEVGDPQGAGERDGGLPSRTDVPSLFAARTV